MDSQTRTGVHTLGEAFYISKWSSQENVVGQTICLHLSSEKYGHPALFLCQTLKTKNQAGEGPHSCSDGGWSASALCVTEDPTQAGRAGAAPASGLAPRCARTFVDAPHSYIVHIPVVLTVAEQGWPLGRVWATPKPSLGAPTSPVRHSSWAASRENGDRSALQGTRGLGQMQLVARR